MANIFLNLPATPGDGTGAQVDVSAMGKRKTITVTGDFKGGLLVQFSADGTDFATLHTFVSPGKQSFDLAARFMRVLRQNNPTQGDTGSAQVELASNDNGAKFFDLPATAGNGTGAQVDVSTLGTFNTVTVLGSFLGVVTIQISEDGTDWADCMSFNGPGVQSKSFVAQFMRAVRAGVPTQVAPGLPNIDVAAINDATSAVSAEGSPLLLNNIKNFGAVGDGVTDDTVAIQAAITDAITDSVGGIFIPAGDYRVNFTGLSVPAATNFSIYGVGAESILRFIDGDLLNANATLLEVSSLTRGLFTDFVLDGNEANISNPGTEVYCLDTQDAVQLNMRDVFVRASSTEAVRIGSVGSGDDEIDIHNCHIIAANAAAFLIEGGVRISIESNRIVCTAANAFFVSTAPSGNDLDGLFLHNNDIQGGNDAPIQFAGTGTHRGISITNNRATGGATAFVTFGAAATYETIPIIAGNQSSNNTLFPEADLANLEEPAICVGGGAVSVSAGLSIDSAGTQFVGTGTPEANVTGSVGDSFQRLDGAGLTYRKVSGFGDTGWVQDATLDQNATVQPFTAGQVVNQRTLVEAATIAVAGANSNNFELELTASGNTLGAPTNVRPGMAINVAVRQDAGGGNTLLFNAAWKFPGGPPTISAGSLDEDMISGYVRAVDGSNNATVIICGIAQNATNP